MARVAEFFRHNWRLATTGAKGLIPALSGSASQYFGGDGNWYDLPEATNWFLTDSASDIGGYKALDTTIPGGAKANVSAAITAADTLIDEWASTAAETPQLISEQVMHFHLHFAKTAGTKEAQIYVKFFHRTGAGVETLLGTSEMSGNAPGAEGETELSVAISDTEFAATDRGVMKVYGTPVGLGTDPTVAIYYDGTTYSRVEGNASLPTNAADLTFTQTQVVAGRNTAGAGAGEEVTLSQLLDWIGSAARGDLLYRGASAWARLAKGTDGDVLTQGADDPSWAAPSGGGGYHNLCLNPGFETQLYGTHTTAITQINAASTTRNLSLPAWQWVSGTGSPDATITQDMATIQITNSRASAKVVIDGLGTSNPRLRQIWNSTHWLESLVYHVRGKYLTFAVDLKLSAGTANAARAFITTDGTGGTTTYSSYKANDTDWERMLVSVQIPTDATSIEFGVYFESATPDYYLDNCMAVCSDAALTSCAFVPRLPVVINSQGSNHVDNVNQFSWTNATGTSTVTGSGGADTDYSVNANRPHWATKIEMMFNVGASAGNFAGAQPYGATNLYVFEFSGAIIFGPCLIGQDGQLLVSRSSTAIDIAMSIKNWVGEGL